MASSMALLFASLLFPVVIALPWIGPMPTPIGLMAIAGVSPRPTEAPGLKGIPQELLRRQDVQYPPPANWCGFVNGIYGQSAQLRNRASWLTIAQTIRSPAA